jgi:hypothetical protein
MGGRGALAALAFAVLAAAAPASAQEPIGVAYPEIVNVGPGQLRAMRDTPVTFAGRLTVEFRGDAAAGCAITGVCGLAGAVTWRPPQRGELAVAESVQRDRRWFTVTLGAVGESVARPRDSSRR